ncbi:MAG: N-acetylglucosamine-6-phosphate deacetylase [Eubacteriales bacterium]|nr:N-acetylglucosamine-6-phosphate deacetylase [Eubacteriales bacterium]
MIIKNGEVFQEDGTFQKKDLYIEGHMLAEREEQVSDQEVIDAGGLLVIPGLVDIHSHGAAGHDFSDGDTEGLRRILRYQREHGITSYCPTSMTLPSQELKEIFATAKEAADDREGAVIRGINMEGPYLDPGKKGAHVESHIRRPDAADFRELNEASGHMVKLVTLAPNVEGAMEFIDQVHEEVCVSLGHTGADYSTAAEAMRRGAHHITHLYNAMQPFGHREPGLIGAALDDPLCMVELICDGLHIHPSVIRSAFSMFGPERVVLISDSMMAAGMENGTYQLGGQEVTVKDRRATLKDGTLAGSATNLFDCMRTAVSFGIPLRDAIFAVSRNPAKSIGIYDQVGSLVPGKEADALLVTKSLELVSVL